MPIAKVMTATQNLPANRLNFPIGSTIAPRILSRVSKDRQLFGRMIAEFRKTVTGLNQPISLVFGCSRSKIKTFTFL
jgi:hypothetical protein